MRKGKKKNDIFPHPVVDGPILPLRNGERGGERRSKKKEINSKRLFKALKTDRQKINAKHFAEKNTYMFFPKLEKSFETEVSTCMLQDVHKKT